MKLGRLLIFLPKRYSLMMSVTMNMTIEAIFIRLLIEKVQVLLHINL